MPHSVMMFDKKLEERHGQPFTCGVAGLRRDFFSSSLVCLKSFFQPRFEGDCYEQIRL